MTEKKRQIIQALFDLSGRVTVITGEAGLWGRQFSEALAEAGAGVIINIGSIYPWPGVDEKPLSMPVIATAAYSAIKGGLLTLTRHLAITWTPPGIRANCLSPGGFPSETTQPEFIQNFTANVPPGRIGDQTDLKGAIVYLAAEASTYVTGQNRQIDGGWIAW